MKFMRNMIIAVSLISFVICAKQMQRSARQPRIPAVPTQPVTTPTNIPKEWVEPDINKLPAPLNQTPEGYAQNKVAALSQQLVNEIFPKEGAIERLVFAFRDEYPGSVKETDVRILYNAIINDPELKKFITLKNAVPVYNFIKETLNKAWDKKENLS